MTFPRDKDVYVYCGSGYRASAVVSMLEHLGYDNLIHVDDNFGNAAEVGLEVVTETRAKARAWLDMDRLPRQCS